MFVLSPNLRGRLSHYISWPAATQFPLASKEKQALLASPNKPTHPIATMIYNKILITKSITLATRPLLQILSTLLTLSLEELKIRVHAQ
jgi:hypothetical protein